MIIYVHKSQFYGSKYVFHQNRWKVLPDTSTCGIVLLHRVCTYLNPFSRAMCFEANRHSSQFFVLYTIEMIQSLPIIIIPFIYKSMANDYVNKCTKNIKVSIQFSTFIMTLSFDERIMLAFVDISRWMYSINNISLFITTYNNTYLSSSVHEFSWMTVKLPHQYVSSLLPYFLDYIAVHFPNLVTFMQVFPSFYSFLFQLICHKQRLWIRPMAYYSNSGIRILVLYRNWSKWMYFHSPHLKLNRLVFRW